jgi:hypothetical protein
MRENSMAPNISYLISDANREEMVDRVGLEPTT